MNDLEQELCDLGFSHEHVVTITDIVEALDRETARVQAAEFLQRVILRIGKDSAAGCALRRALGCSSETSLDRAAKDFCVDREYLAAIHRELMAKLGDLSFASPPPPTGTSGGGRPSNAAGPFGETMPDR